MIATYGLMIFSYQYFTAYIITIPLVLYIDSFIFTRIKNMRYGNGYC
jgi:hypothetical protein